LSPPTGRLLGDTTLASWPGRLDHPTSRRPQWRASPGGFALGGHPLEQV